MNDPYATIIIPTFDRHTTLPFAVRSLQNQTVHDIEILVVGDGCTADVRNVTQALAGADSRVRFLDLPKAPMRGAANRDRAVREACAPRIFYCDDDDVVLPHHVEVLGAELDRMDIVDTPAASIRLYGPAALGILNSGHRTQRELLKSGRLKSIFDTHLAHSKKTYLDRAPAWLTAPDRGVVLHLLKGFADDESVTWKTLQRITACSFHGARRVNASPSARASELEHLSRRLSRDLEQALRAEGGYASYALILLSALSDTRIVDAASLFGAVGVVADIEGATADETGAGRLSLSAHQASAVNAVIDAWQGRKPSIGCASRAVAELLEPLHGPFFHIQDWLHPFVATLGAGPVAAILNDLPGELPVLLARVHLKLRAGELAAAVSDARTALDLAPQADKFAVGLAVAEDLKAHGRSDFAWDWTTETIPVTTQSFLMARFWRLQATLASERGASADEAFAIGQVAAMEGMET